MCSEGVVSREGGSIVSMGFDICVGVDNVVDGDFDWYVGVELWDFVLFEAWSCVEKTCVYDINFLEFCFNRIFSIRLLFGITLFALAFVLFLLKPGVFLVAGPYEINCKEYVDLKFCSSRLLSIIAGCDTYQPMDVANFFEMLKSLQYPINL
uniref:Uncharacterized protein n=1 Tax=Glossina austeni TaxID=7395 RepID=A0A1A9V4N3_GLOAU